MLRIVAILALAPVAASQCMLVPKDAKVKGTASNQVSQVGNTRLLDCIDDCLTNARQECQLIAFNDHLGSCLIVNGSPASICENCTVMQKTTCEDFTDFHCFIQRPYGFNRQHYLHNIDTQDECRWICIFTVNCKGYTWRNTRKRCGLFVNRPYNNRRLGEISAIKKRQCKSTRATLLSFGAYLPGRGTDDAVTSMFECYRKFTQEDKVQIAGWDYDTGLCTLHNSGHKTEYSNSKKTTIVVKQNKVDGDKQNLCVKKTPSAAMEGGFPLSDITEQHCVTLCLGAANCAAVTWSRDRICRFHHVIRKITRSNIQVTNYMIVECGKETDSRGILAIHYHRQSSGHVANTFSQACFKCALRCQIKECKGFRCYNKGHGKLDQCSFDDVTEHSYVPRKRINERT